MAVKNLHQESCILSLTVNGFLVGVRRRGQTAKRVVWLNVNTKKGFCDDNAQFRKTLIIFPWYTFILLVW